MEVEKKLHLLFLLPVVFHLSTGSLQDSLHCLNDYNNNITCEWNSTSASDQRIVAADTKCNLSVSIIMEDEDEPYSTSCDLRPFDDSNPTMRTCSLVYSFDDVFFSDLTCSININCEPLKNSLIGIITYKPADHIKLSPPGRPSINYSTISWKVPGNNLIKDYSFHIQWKQIAQSWKDALERNRIHCGLQCQMELDPDKDLELDEMYQVRVRVLASESWAKSTWSNWSPTASWRSLVGRIKTTGNRLQDQLDGHSVDGRSVLESWDFMVGVIVGVVVLFLAIILCKTKKNTWVYVVKKFEGPPLPNPAKFFLQDGNLKAWLNPQFNNESIHSCLKKVDISSVEVTSNADNIALCGSEAALLDQKQCGSFMSTNSSFSNPSYSHLCPPPISSLTEGNLEPCFADSPYGPSDSQNEREEERGKDMEVLKKFSIGSVMQESSERVENLQPQSCGLFSTESGICSGEDQFIQDSLNNGDKACIYDGEGKELPAKDRGKEKGKQIHVSNWFTSGKVTFSGRCIEVCSDYERVEKLQDQFCGLQSPDSCICSGGEEQVSQDSLDDGDGITAGHGKELQGTHSDKEKGKQINGSNLVAVGGIVSGGSIQVCSDYERVEKLQDLRCGLQSPDSGMGSEVEEQVSQETLVGIRVDGLGGSKSIPPLSFTPIPFTFVEFGTSSPVGTFLGLMQEGLSAFPSTRPIESSSGDYMPVREI